MALFLCAALPARADNVHLVPGGAAFDDPKTNFSMSPYTVIVNGQTTQVFCVDFSSPVANNASWTATATALVSATGYANALQYQMTGSNAAAQTNYLEMAWLSLQLQAALAVDNLPVAGQDQWAIWSFSGGLDPYGTNAALLAQAQTAVNGGFTVSGWKILTPDSLLGNTGQEFLIQTTVPEPSTVLLLLTGLGIAAGAMRYRKTLSA
jgi:hypothetical protein